MATSPLESLTNIPIAVKQLLGNEIGKVTFVPAPLPHCSGIRQWGTTSKPGTITLPIAFTKFYIPISCHGHNKDWFPSQYPSTVYVVSLNQLSYGAAEGTYHYFIAIGK